MGEHKLQKRGFSGNAQPPMQQMKINYGHNGERVMVMFSQPVRNLALTETECDDAINGLRGAKDMLAAYKAAKS